MFRRCPRELHHRLYPGAPADRREKYLDMDNFNDFKTHFLRQEMLLTYGLILDDFKKLGRCDFTVAKKPDNIVMFLVYATAKSSPYTEQISRGYFNLLP